mgnify:CR=1 FL=1
MEIRKEIEPESRMGEEGSESRIRMRWQKYLQVTRN